MSKLYETEHADKDKLTFRFRCRNSWIKIETLDADKRRLKSCIETPSGLKVRHYQYFEWQPFLEIFNLVFQEVILFWNQHLKFISFSSTLDFEFLMPLSWHLRHIQTVLDRKKKKISLF